MTDPARPRGEPGDSHRAAGRRPRGGRRAAASSTAGVSRSRRSRMNSPRKPSVLFVFYTHTHQSLRVADAMAGVLRERGCDVALAGIEFTDPRYAGNFSRFPFRHAVFALLAVLPAQVRRSTGQIRIPDAAREGDYDLVCFGSPTWVFTTNMPF